MALGPGMLRLWGFEECLVQVLCLSRNAFVEWPLPTSRLPSLRQLDLSGNGRLLSAPQDALQCCAGTLQELDLSGNASPSAGLKAASATSCELSCSWSEIGRDSVE